MKAMIYRAYGGPEVLQLAEVAEPKLWHNGILVRIKAAAVNPADIVLQSGVRKELIDTWFPAIPGWDAAGVVESIGPGVSEFQPGDEVIGYVRQEILRNGTYAEKVASSVAAFARKPRNVTWAQAAALPLAGLTAYQAVQALALAKGEVVLIHGAAGGVGSLAVQMAVMQGARVVGSASRSSEGYLRSIGIEPVAYEEDIVKQLRSLVPAGVDAVLDCAGHGALSMTPQMGTARVRAVTIADPAAGFPMVYVRSNVEQLNRLVEWVEAGFLRVRVAAAYPLEQAARAQQALKDGQCAGKIVLHID